MLPLRLLGMAAMADTCSWSTVSDGEEDYDQSISSLEKDEYEDFKEAEVKSLQLICLDSIKENFDRFIEAHSKSSDKVLQKHLLFLQRKYTEELLSHFSKGGIPEQYMHFFLNENLKRINLDDFRKCKGSDILIQMEKIGESVLSFQPGRWFGPNNQSDSKESRLVLISQILGCIPNVEELYFSKLCTNEILKTVSSLANLKKLYFFDCADVTEDGIENFCSCFENSNSLLTTLSLKPIALGEDTIITILSKFPLLEILEHNSLVPALTSKYRENILTGTVNNIQATNLTVLEPLSPVYSDMKFINGNTMYLFIKILPAICPNLNNLSVIIHEEEHLQCLANFSQLERLKLESSKFDRPFLPIKNIPNFANLQHVSFERFSFSVSTLLECCSKLDSLELSEIEFNKDEATDLKKYVTSIKELDMDNIRFDKMELSPLEILFGSCSKLETLSLTACDFPEYDDEKNERIVNFISKSSLQHLNIFLSNVKSAFISSLLLSCKTLQSILIDDCSDITLEEIKTLYEIAKLNRTEIRFKDSHHRGLSGSPASFIGFDDEYDDYDYEDYDYYNYDDDEDDSDDF